MIQKMNGQNSYSYNRVSRNITVHNAQLTDAGNFVCKVTDATPRHYYANYTVSIRETALEPTIAFSVQGIDLMRPLSIMTGSEFVFAVIVYAVPDKRSITMYWMKVRDVIVSAVS